MSSKPETTRTFEVSLQDMREVAKFMLETPERRVQLSQAFVGHQSTPPWLNDEVVAGLRFCGYLDIVDRPRRDGDMIVTAGRGDVAVLDLTERGRLFAHGSPHPVVDVIGKS